MPDQFGLLEKDKIQIYSHFSEGRIGKYAFIRNNYELSAY